MTVAWVLSSNGKKVLVIDWDLDAPGLHWFFPDVVGQNTRDDQSEQGERTVWTEPGLLDLVHDYVGNRNRYPDEKPEKTAERVLRDVVTTYVIRETGIGFGERDGGGHIHLMSAGIQHEGYPRQLLNLDWNTLFERSVVVRKAAGTGEAIHEPDASGELPEARLEVTTRSPFLDEFRRKLCAEYDYVLIDSRTGVGEIAAITTLTLAHRVVNCFGISRQSVAGAIRVAEDLIGRGRAVLPVPTRVDTGDGARADAGRQEYRRLFNPLLRKQGGWISEMLGEYWRRVEIPYSPAWALEEMPAPVRPDDDEVIRACEYIAHYATADARSMGAEPARLRLPDRERLRQSWSSALRGPKSAFAHVVVTHAPAEEEWALWVDQVLSNRGFGVTRHLVAGVRADGDEAADRELLVRRMKKRYEGVHCVVPILPRNYSEEMAEAFLVRYGRGLLTQNKDLCLEPMVVHEEVAAEQQGTRLYGMVADVATNVVQDLLGEPLGGGGQRSEPPEIGSRVRYPGSAPENPDQVVAQRLANARQRNDVEGVIGQQLLRGQFASANRRLADAARDFDAVLALVSREKKRLDEARQGRTSDDGGVDPAAKEERLRLFEARALLGLGQVRLGSRDFRRARRLFDRAGDLSRPEDFGTPQVAEAWRVRVRLLLARVDLVADPLASEVERAAATGVRAIRAELEDVTTRMQSAPLRRELAEAWLARARLERASAAGATPSEDEIYRWRASALKAREIFESRQDVGGVARAYLEQCRIEQRLPVRSPTIENEILRNLRLAERRMNQAGPSPFDLVIRHDILICRGEAEPDDEDALASFERALNLASAHADRYPELVARSYYRLGSRKRDDQATEQYARAVAELQRAVAKRGIAEILPIPEYGDAFKIIRRRIYEGDFDESFLSTSEFDVGHDAAMRTAVWAASTKLRLGDPGYVQEVGRWLSRRPAIEVGHIRDFVHLQFDESHEAEHLLAALRLPEHPPMRATASDGGRSDGH
jgi:tetratricopeptide (TPR) repeat protein/cellulose biosynthesis protein BcsQ